MKVLLHPDIYPVACKKLENWRKYQRYGNLSPVFPYINCWHWFAEKNEP